MNRVDPERRRFVRYQVSLPVEFSWTAVDAPQQGTGFTRDVSAVGAFVVTVESSPSPEVGTSMWMQIAVGPGVLGSKRPSVLQMDARSERIEAEGFAVSFAAPVE